MNKPAKPPARLPVNAKPARVPAANARLGAQNRKLLTKHYRAKHGVR
jgi:hypothetical protein